MSETPQKGSVIKGAGLGCLIQVVSIVIWIGIATVGPSNGSLLAVVGIVQAVAILPFALMFRSSGEKQTMQGLIILAIAGFIITLPCWLLLGGLNIH